MSNPNKQATTSKKGVIMGTSKNSVLVLVVLTVVLVLAFAGTAMAVDRSGQTRGGNSAVATGTVNGVPTAGAGTNTYVDWDTTKGTNSLSVSPHGNFTTTTQKCAVCHATHYAGAGKAPVASGTQTADTLLRMRADQACVYCHVTTGQTVDGKPVFDGVMPVASGGSTNTGHRTGTNCSYCHASVHGANQDSSVAAVKGLMLKTRGGMSTTAPTTQRGSTDILSSIRAINATAAAQGFGGGDAAAVRVTGFTEAEWTNNASVGDEYRMQAVGIFCAECHDGSYAQVEAGASTNLQAITSGGKTGTGNGLLSGHRTMASVNASWNADGAISSGSRTIGQTAYSPATNCTSCHDARDTFGNTAFPHSWGGTKMWLMSGSFAGDAKTALPYGTAPNSGATTGRPQLSDGVCLKCHAGSTDGVTADKGVGKNY